MNFMYKINKHDNVYYFYEINIPNNVYFRFWDDLTKPKAYSFLSLPNDTFPRW